MDIMDYFCDDVITYGPNILVAAVLGKPFESYPVVVEIFSPRKQ
jgi:hypothetical protein